MFAAECFKVHSQYRIDSINSSPPGRKNTLWYVHASSVIMFKNRIDKYIIKVGYN